MESEKSRIPVYSFQQPKVISELKDMQHSKDQCINKETYTVKEPDLTFGGNASVCVVFKGTNQRLVKSSKKAAAAPPPPKKMVAAMVRSPVSRYRREAELRNKNKLLETTKCDLNLKLAGMQSAVQDLKEQNDVLEKENQKLKQFQETCMLILEARNCDPVTGNTILEEEEVAKKTRSEVMVLTEVLNADLELFNQLAKEQKENLQNTKLKWKQAEDDQAHFLQQLQSFNSEIEELSALSELSLLDQEDALLNS
ncbi:uncharacterized protein LOC128340460 isoform X2 [Hemicordylus capensis]|uniref:uncharacterized protein LOC128340460 isoform X2 n=1 Tax=Hemicordylus capensis TaxID=884348 RepID=UPI002303A278|nr:uncharacterized protein LOC128340460 isoform X2 [Hemicordylus capensis]